MKNYFILCIGIIALTLTSTLHAILQTDTHTYLMSSREQAILAINRQTGEETKMQLGVNPLCMVIHGDYGYVLMYSPSTVIVLDLHKHQVSKTILIDDTFSTSMMIHEDKAFVMNICHEKIHVVDLQKQEVTNIIEIRSHPISMEIHKGMGYVLCESPHNLKVIDIQKQEIIETIDVDGSTAAMVIHKDFAYLVKSVANTIDVFDLSKLKFTKTIPVGQRPRSIVIHGETGFVINSQSDSVTVIDLLKQEVIKTIGVGGVPWTMVTYGDMGFVKHSGSTTVTVIDLTTHIVVSTLNNPKRESIGFSDTHLYLGFEMVCPHFYFPRLFDCPYSGINCSWVSSSEGEEAFTTFEKIMWTPDQRAKEKLEIALAAGDPKAYAFAAFCFLYTKCGANDDDALFWYLEFSRSMDQAYFSSLVEGYFKDKREIKGKERKRTKIKIRKKKSAESKRESRLVGYGMPASNDSDGGCFSPYYGWP